jgi:hypothetical protein
MAAGHAADSITAGRHLLAAVRPAGGLPAGRDAPTTVIRIVRRGGWLVGFSGSRRMLFIGQGCGLFRRLGAIAAVVERGLWLGHQIRGLKDAPIDYRQLKRARTKERTLAKPSNEEFLLFLQSRQPRRFRQFGFYFDARQPDILQNLVAEVYQLAVRTFVPTPRAEAMSQTVPKTASHSAGLRPVLEPEANGRKGQSKNSDVVGPVHGVSPRIGLIVFHLTARRIRGGCCGKIDKEIFLRGPAGLTQFKPSNGAIPTPRPAGTALVNVAGRFSVSGGVRGVGASCLSAK